MKDLNSSEIPTSVYRLQLNSDFPLKRATEILPYLKKLGVEGIYCSPYYDAYSPHGYDVTNPNTLNSQIGTPDEYADFCAELKRLDLKQIIDVVPNHMGIRGGKNAWWQDVLQKGPHSHFAKFFDIDWDSEKEELKNRVLLPILGCRFGEALQDRQITLSYQHGRYTLHYADYPLPVAAHSYEILFEHGESPEEIVRAFNDHPKLLATLLDAQYYRLAHWRLASHQLNYRRFFNIHELVAIRIEEDEVFESHHRWLFELIEKQQVQGLRIDHPDGLYNPAAYFQKMRERVPIYTVVEKILEREEKLPTTWQVEGTVGYESINVFSGLFVKHENGDAFTKIYDDFIGSPSNFDEILYQSKKLFAGSEMASEVESLGLSLHRLCENHPDFREFSRIDLTHALSDVVAAFPVYRTYIREKGKVSKRDSTYILEAMQKARARAKDLDPALFHFLEDVLLLRIKEQGYREFVLRFQQLTGPMMAKGLEDTAFYIYNRFISLNEVGGDPCHFGYSIKEFHRFNKEKLKNWPFGFLASSTHDTKRSEDVRMRLNVLSEMPERWQKEVQGWAAINARHKGVGPSGNLEYFIYQTLLGAWPQEGMTLEQLPGFSERIWEVVLKSMREAKQETSWLSHDEAYEQSVKDFLFAILKDRAFMERFLPFQEEIDRFGALNSLSATAVKLGSCGVVDLYQGNETYAYRLVDPDNRKPVDFAGLEKLFTSSDPKFFLHRTLLPFRSAHRELFLEGEYIPLKVKGAGKEHVIAFMRRTAEESLIVVATRFFTGLKPGIWSSTHIVISGEWRGVDLLTEKAVHTKTQGTEHRLHIASLLDSFPVCYLHDQNS